MQPGRPCEHLFPIRPDGRERREFVSKPKVVFRLKVTSTSTPEKRIVGVIFPLGRAVDGKLQRHFYYELVSRVRVSLNDSIGVVADLQSHTRLKAKDRDKSRPGRHVCKACVPAPRMAALPPQAVSSRRRIRSRWGSDIVVRKEVSAHDPQR